VEVSVVFAEVRPELVVLVVVEQNRLRELLARLDKDLLVGQVTLATQVVAVVVLLKLVTPTDRLRAETGLLPL
jgi:hypothetical protein